LAVKKVKVRRGGKGSARFVSHEPRRKMGCALTGRSSTEQGGATSLTGPNRSLGLHLFSNTGSSNTPIRSSPFALTPPPLNSNQKLACPIHIPLTLPPSSPVCSKSSLSLVLSGSSSLPSSAFSAWSAQPDSFSNRRSSACGGSAGSANAFARVVGFRGERSECQGFR
jgi:hypothetical protein